MKHQIKTSEEDTGLWSVRRNGELLGYIWEPQAETRICNRLFKRNDPIDDPRFVALDDWLSIKPGNPIEGCKTWHQALSAVVRYAALPANMRFPVAQSHTPFTTNQFGQI